MRAPVQSTIDRHIARLRSGLVSSALAVLGRPVRCELCGRVLFKGLPFVWHGGLKLFGAERAFVRADWDTQNRLVFQHVEAERCRELMR